MSTLLEGPESATSRSTSPAHRMRTTMAAVRVSFTWFGTRKTLTPEQKAQAADTFGAEGEFLSAGKKLLDTRHPAFRAVTAVRNRVLSFWKGITLPFPESGTRLLRLDDIGELNLRLTTLCEDLREAVQALDRRYPELKTGARTRLGSLHNPADYPDSLVGLFAIDWEFPSVEPPDYLLRLAPRLYEQEQARIAARFDEAVLLAEQAFLAELNSLVSHLVERLSGQTDGKPKIFRDSAVENLTEFFERFRRLNVRSNEQLDELVDQAQQIVRGVEPQGLRDSRPLRQDVAAQLAGVQSVLDGLLVDRPRRNILRRTR